jgi:hypothetical protein
MAIVRLGTSHIVHKIFWVRIPFGGLQQYVGECIWEVVVGTGLADGRVNVVLRVLQSIH